MASNRSLLLVSSAYPPSSEVGAARWEGFTPYLASAGWELEVIMAVPEPEVYDAARRDRLGGHVSVEMVPRRDPLWRQLILRAVRAARRNRRMAAGPSTTEVVTAASTHSVFHAMHPQVLFSAAVIAARQRRWIADVVARATRLKSNRSHSIVISSGPPHDAHVAAQLIAEKMRLPHIVDLRDPWIGNPGVGAQSRYEMVPSPVDAEAERRVLTNAVAVITNTPGAAAALIARMPLLAERVHTILNGSDHVAAEPRTLALDDRFLVVHTGTLYMDRDPRAFLRAVSSVRTKLGANGARIALVFMGHPAMIDGRSLAECAAELGLETVFQQQPFGTRDAAMQLMDSAAMLVAFQGAAPTQIPAKIFDYVSHAASLLALTDADSATASILAGTTARIASLDDEEAIADQIFDAASRAFAGEPIVPVDHDGRFSRSKQAAHLLRLLDTLAL